MAALYALFILVMALIPLSIPDEVERFDPEHVTLHFIEYSIFGALLWWAFADLRFVLLVGPLYGVLLELLHLVVPYRDFYVWDMVANVTGVAFGVLSARAVLPKPRVKPEEAAA